ncbi:MAG: L,D-transpeptidase family protein [Campylobacterota bacterium]|nr:L,D-transpeptidase family protein [Campylobacterota bacterium]
MIKVKNRIKRLCATLGILFLCIFPQNMLANTNLLYHDVASTVIMNSLESRPKESFLRKLYTRLFFVPVWMNESKPSAAATALFNHIKNDNTLNKNGKLYLDTLRLEGKIEDVYANYGKLVDKVDLEFKVSQLYKAYTNYAYLGSINWGAFQARISNLIVNDVSTEWVLHRPKVDAIAMLENAALGGDLGEALELATPTKYHYRALQKKVAAYREIKANGGWERVDLISTLKPGQKVDGVVSLRERLRVTGDHDSCDESVDERVYDTCLEQAVRHFQKRNGLSVDGEVGPATLAALNKTVDERIETMLLNLDRIKWLRKPDSKRHIIINIPDFMLYFEEDGNLIQTIRTVVGTPKNPTPIFSNQVKTIVLNPQWNVPKSIIQNEMIPKLLRNSNAMRKERIEIFNGWGGDAKKIDPGTVNWSKYRYSKHVPFRFAQTSGTHNALGKVKFLFPNKFSVYMHDTPSKHLFSRDKRAFSHGCIRLQKPRELLETFSTFNDNVDFEKSQDILEGNKKAYLALNNRVPVDIIYLTAWVDYEGGLQFRNDIYEYDKMKLKSFRKW